MADLYSQPMPLTDDTEPGALCAEHADDLPLRATSEMSFGHSISETYTCRVCDEPAIAAVTLDPEGVKFEMDDGGMPDWYEDLLADWSDKVERDRRTRQALENLLQDALDVEEPDELTVFGGTATHYDGIRFPVLLSREAVNRLLEQEDDSDG